MAAAITKLHDLFPCSDGQAAFAAGLAALTWVILRRPRRRPERHRQPWRDARPGAGRHSVNRMMLGSTVVPDSDVAYLPAPPHGIFRGSDVGLEHLVEFGGIALGKAY